MESIIPHDIECFLMELGTLRIETPGAYEAFARAAADILYTKYCVIQNASLPVFPAREAPFQA